MVYRALITIALLLGLNGCAAAHAAKAKPVRPTLMADIYARGSGDAQNDTAKFIDENLKEQKTFGYVKPYVPVIEQPVVRKVWVPDHKLEEDGSVLVGGHWVYLMITGPRWFVENETQEARVSVIVPAQPQSVQPAPVKSN